MAFLGYKPIRYKSVESGRRNTMSLGPLEIVLIVFVVLIFFGPSRLPSLGKSVGSAIRGFKKGISGDEDKSLPPSERQNDKDT